MSSPKPRDQIERAAHSLVEEVKNAVALNLTVVAQQNNIDITSEAHTKLMNLVMQSIDEGYHKGSRTFGKHVEEALVGTSAHIVVVPKKKTA